MPELPLMRRRICPPLASTLVDCEAGDFIGRAIMKYVLVFQIEKNDDFKIFSLIG